MTKFLNLQYTGVFEWIKEVPEGRNVVGGCIFCKEKLNEQGVLVKRKVCIITQSFLQISREDFTETFVLVLKFTTLQILFAITAYHNFELHQMDIVVAFLNGELDEEIYMKVPNSICKFAPSGSSRRC